LSKIMFFQSEVHLLSFEQSTGSHWARENALNRCFHRCIKWTSAMIFCCLLDLFDLLNNSAPTWKEGSFLRHLPHKSAATSDKFRDHSCRAS
jgi:hypothetical protein